MNKTDRMLAIVLELQRRGTRRAEDLAATFETSVRTIYRDMQALSEAGVPVVGAPGQGYSLMEGYFLPPVSFTAEESVSLLIGSELIEQRFDADYAAHARSARGKIEAVLPEPVRQEASRIRSAVKLLAVGRPVSETPEDDVFRLLRRAILEERKVRFHYRKLGLGLGPGLGPTSERPAWEGRTVAPYGLVLARGVWLLVARCDLRQDIRHFRLTRMEGAALTEEPFVKPPDFDLPRYSPPDDRVLPVRVRVSPGIAERVKESGHFFLEAVQDGDSPEAMLLLFRVRKPDDLLNTVMGWGAEAEVLEPEELRQRVREEIFQMAKRY